MFELSDFYTHCENSDIDVIPYLGAPGKGITVRDSGLYAIFLDFTQIPTIRELKGICCHELGHAATGALHKINSPYESVERSEYRANRWTAEHYLTADRFRVAFSSGCTEPWQLAEYFDLPEQDVKSALSYWTERRGITFN